MSTRRKKYLSFDPTIHAGHILTALAVVGSALSIWYGMQNTLSNHEARLSEHGHRMDASDARAVAERERTDRKIDELTQYNNQALIKLRDDMNGWFMALNDKLDRKADKR